MGAVLLALNLFGMHATKPRPSPSIDTASKFAYCIPAFLNSIDIELLLGLRWLALIHLFLG
jgi:hypothetical protein